MFFITYADDLFPGRLSERGMVCSSSDVSCAELGRRRSFGEAVLPVTMSRCYRRRFNTRSVGGERVLRATTFRCIAQAKAPEVVRRRAARSTFPGTAFRRSAVGNFGERKTSKVRSVGQSVLTIAEPRETHIHMDKSDGTAALNRLRSIPFRSDGKHIAAGVCGCW